MAHVSNMTLELSDKTRVLQAALQLPTFTIEQLAQLSGVKGTVVAATVNRLKDLIEEIGSGGGGQRPAGRPPRYRLRESARAKVVREAVELTERLRGPPRSSVEDTARGAGVALDAVESSIELGAQREGAGQGWELRAREQLDLARRLLVLVKDPVHRTPLQRRLVQLASRLEGSEQPPLEESEQFGPPSVPTTAEPLPQPTRVFAKGPRTIWKYPNRRLYDALERRYITLADIYQLVIHNVEFVVIEKRGRVDITRAILLQIVAEREGAMQGSATDPVLRRDFLAEIIRSCDGAPRGMIVTYLEQSLRAFASGQKNESGGGGQPPR